MENKIQVGENGTLTLPKKLCRKYRICTGDTFHLVDVDGVFILSRKVPVVTKLATEIEQMRREAGLTTHELLIDLRDQRETYHSEKYS